MNKITPMFIENLLVSLIKDNGMGCEADKSPNWHDFFPYVKPVSQKVATAPNTQNLSVWRNGRGAFSDVDIFIDEDTNCFVDIKGCPKQPKLSQYKTELWAGRANKKKSANYSWEGMTPEEVTKAIKEEYHQHKVGLQIHESLTSLERPYIVGFTWAGLDANGKVIPMVQLVNASKYYDKMGETNNAIKRRNFILRKKASYNKVAGVTISVSYSCRVEMKILKDDPFEYLASIGAITKPFVWNEIQEKIKTII